MPEAYNSRMLVALTLVLGSLFALKFIFVSYALMKRLWEGPPLP